MQQRSGTSNIAAASFRHKETLAALLQGGDTLPPQGAPAIKWETDWLVVLLAKYIVPNSNSFLSAACGLPQEDWMQLWPGYWKL